MTAIGDTLYFTANDGTHGYELWKANGTTATMIQDISVGAGDSSPSGFASLGSYVYFSATTSESGNELWRTNGTTATIVSDIYPGTNGSSITLLVQLGNYILFQADDGEHGYEMWRTNGTTTTRLTDINTTGSSYPYSFTVLGDYVYFTAYDGTSWGNLWRSTADGALDQIALPGTNAGLNCECNPITNVNGRLYTFFYSDETGGEFAWLDEPTYVLPSTNNAQLPWHVALLQLAALTAAGAIALRMRAVKRA